MIERRGFLKAIASLPFLSSLTSNPALSDSKAMPGKSKTIVTKEFVVDNRDAILFDFWPGSPTLGCNPDDWAGVSLYEDFPVGTKRQVYNAGMGWTTLIYLYYRTAPWCGRRRLCCMDFRSERKYKKGGLFGATNVKDKSQIEYQPIAIHVGDRMIDKSFAWFWCGGPPPLDAVRGMRRKMLNPIKQIVSYARSEV